MNRDKNNIVTFNNTNGIDIGKTKCFHTLSYYFVWAVLQAIKN